MMTNLISFPTTSTHIRPVRPMPLLNLRFGDAKLNVEVKTLPFSTQTRPLPNVKVFTGSAFPELARMVADKLGLPLSKSELKTFPDRHTFARIDETVRNQDVVIIQPTSGTADGPSPNDNIFELAQLITSAKQAEARSVTIVNPFYGYSRSDRSVKDREVAAAKLVTDFLVMAGADRIISGDIHNKAITSFTNKSFKNLKLLPVLGQYIKENYDLSEVVVVSPDHGGTKRSTQVAKLLGKGNYVGIFDKRRDDNGALLPDPIFIGNPDSVKGKVVVMGDDIIDTAGTICQNADALMKMGAKKVIVIAAHGFFTKDALDKIQKSSISEVVVSNSMALSAKAKLVDKITQVSIAPVIAEYISRLLGTNESMAELKE